MVRSAFDSIFRKKFSKIRDKVLKERVIKLIEKIGDNPEIGKPMKHGKKGTREVYIPPFRLSYAYLENENKVVFLNIYHKDEQ